MILKMMAERLSGAPAKPPKKPVGRPLKLTAPPGWLSKDARRPFSDGGFGI